MIIDGQTLIHGDCLIELKNLESDSIDSIITDPPYELGFMNKHWDNSGIAYNIDLWKECLRVLKPGGHLLSFGGTRTYHRMTCAIEDAGFEIRDMIEWVYGCLSFDAEVLTSHGFRRLHKLTQCDKILIYDSKNNVYKWEKPQRWSIYKVNKDTAYRIKSNHTDQIVSRNHNCLVEREGKLIFVKAEKLLEMEYMPVLSNDILALCENTAWPLLLQSVLWKIKGVAKNIFSKRTGSKTAWQRIIGCFKPRMERWDNLFSETRELQADKICEMPKGIYTNGKKRRVCDGTSSYNGDGIEKMFIENRGGASYKPQSRRQPSGKSDVVPIKQGTQTIRRARVEKIEYSGIMFCPTVSTGAFIARRKGQIFITGNSGFPKSLNIGKAIDNLQGNEREIIDNNRHGGGSSDIFPERNNKTTTKGNSIWEGWGTALKPSHESIVMARKPLTPVPLDTIIKDVLKEIGGALCQCESFVKTAERCSQSNQKDIKGVANIAQWIADGNTNIRDILSVLTGILQYCIMENMNWNIVSSWLSILADLYCLVNKYTIKMESDLIIELKTLKSLEWLSIFQSIIANQSNPTNGLSCNVQSAIKCFNAVRSSIKDTLMRFVQDNVMLKEESWESRPEHEPICLARKPISEKNIALNVLKWGTGGLNIDESRIKMGVEDRAAYEHSMLSLKNVVGKKYKGFNASTILMPEEYIQNSQLGRFPANLIHDDSDEVKTCFPETHSSARPNLKGKQYKVKEEWQLEGFKQRISNQDNGDKADNASRFFKSIIYTSKASTSERGDNDHPTVKPVELMKYLIKLITPKNGVVLDPFSGSFTTGVACNQLGFKFIGIEKELEYYNIGCERMKANRNLFMEVK